PLAAVAAVQRAHPTVRVDEFGAASAAKAIAAHDAKAGRRAHLISYAVLLLILLAAFGAVVAAGLPLVLGATAVASTVGLLGPVTFLPGVLTVLSRRNWLEKGRVPFIAKRRHATKGESRFWAAVTTRVLARPLLSSVLAGGLLVALSVPALGMQFKNPGFAG